MTNLDKNTKLKIFSNIELPIFCFECFKLALILSRFHKHEEKVNKKYFRKVKESSDQVPYIVHFFCSANSLRTSCDFIKKFRLKNSICIT